MLEHRLYRSDKTGEVISERFTHLTYPWHWHYTVLRGLDYLRLTPAIEDQRADDAIQLLRDRRRPNGRWPLQKRIPGTLLVEMEKPGESRWNTLRALRAPAPRRRRAALSYAEPWQRPQKPHRSSSRPHEAQIRRRRVRSFFCIALSTSRPPAARVTAKTATT
jgi:hypothetical protein